MDAVCERGNLALAYDRVLKNKSAAGVDGIGRADFKEHLKRHWPTPGGRWKNAMAGSGARCAAILWRQWKRPYTRAKPLMKAELTEERAFPLDFQPTRAVAESWRKPHEPGVPEVLL